MLDWLALNALLATLLALIVLAVTRWTRPRPALTHALWLLVLLRLLAPPLPEGPWSLGRPEVAMFTPGGGGSWAPVREEEPIQEQELAPVPSAGAVEAPEARESLSTAPIGRVSATAQEPAASSWSLPDPWTLVLALWGLGALIAAGIQGQRLLRIRALLAHPRPVDDALEIEIERCSGRLGIAPPRASAAPLSSPFVMGLLRPRLVWPTDGPLDITARRSILTHELAHLRRQDHRVAWLELVASILYWWLPGVGFLRRRLRQAADEACDAWVVRLWPRDRRAYAEALVDAVSSAGPRPASAVALGALSGPGRAFERRLVGILEGSGASLSTPARLMVGGLLLGLLPGWAKPAIEPVPRLESPTPEQERNLENVQGTFQEMAAPCLSSPASGVRFAFVRGATVLTEGRIGEAPLEGPHAIGTVTTTYTATLTLHLEQLGLVDLETALGTVLPDLGQESPWSDVRLHHLLEHTAGLPADVPDELSRAPWSEVLRSLRPSGPPGIEPRPSRLGLGLLALGLEHQTGRPLEELMDYLLLEPAGLASTGWREGTDPLQRQAADGLEAEFEDLVRFLSLQMGARIGDAPLPVRAATLRAVQEPRRISNNWLRPQGLGWDQRWSESTESYYQKGSRIGSSSTLLAFSGYHKIGVVLLGHEARGLEQLAVELLASAIPCLSDAQMARDALVGGRLDEAEREYTRLIRTYPEDGVGFYGLGMIAMTREGRVAEALEPLEKAYRAGFQTSNSAYNVACARARMGQIDEAFEWLTVACREGFQNEIFLQTDPDLEPLRSDPRFDELARPSY